ncbi:MAG TPA: PepSY-like domain-containing protein, partial [Chitinophagaceae bacterium]|nr:PepSY-like domain-containing protein [Chitinophagaceae bacterium]
MKLRNFYIVAIIVAIASCKPSYKATDKSRSTTDTTISTTDTTISTTDTMASKTVSVPAGTQTAFTTQYPTATNVIWSNYDTMTVVPIDLELAGWTDMDADDYLVRFDMDNENYYAWYDSDGTWIGSAYVLKDHTQLPAAVNTAVTNKYAGYSITDIDREFQKDRVAYEIEMKKDDS